MPFLDQPFAWTWLLVLGWTAYRLLMGLVFAVREAATLGLKVPAALFGFNMIGSAVVWAIFGALGWRIFVQQAGPVVFVCFGIVAGVAGLLVGFLIDLLLVLRFQRRIAVSIVASKAGYYAELLDLGITEQRIRGALALSLIGSKGLFAVPQLLAAWKDRDAELRYRVAVALFCIQADDPTVVAAMKNGLTDADPRVRAVAAGVLVLRRAADAPELLPALRDGLKLDQEARDIAAQAISELGPAAASLIPDLIALIGEDFDNTFLARNVLASIGEPAVPALISLLQSDSKKVRSTAIDILSEIGSKASKALPVLEDLASRDDKDLRMKAASAIAKIEGDG